MQPSRLSTVVLAAFMGMNETAAAQREKPGIDSKTQSLIQSFYETAFTGRMARETQDGKHQFTIQALDKKRTAILVKYNTCTADKAAVEIYGARMIMPYDFNTKPLDFLAVLKEYIAAYGLEITAINDRVGAMTHAEVEAQINAGSFYEKITVDAPVNSEAEKTLHATIGKRLGGDANQVTQNKEKGLRNPGANGGGYIILSNPESCTP